MSKNVPINKINVWPRLALTPLNRWNVVFFVTCCIYSNKVTFRTDQKVWKQTLLARRTLLVLSTHGSLAVGYGGGGGGWFLSQNVHHQSPWCLPMPSFYFYFFAFCCILKMAWATQPKRHILTKWLLVLWEQEVILEFLFFSSKVDLWLKARWTDAK